MKIKLNVNPAELIAHGHEPVSEVTLDVDLSLLSSEQRKLISLHFDPETSKIFFDRTFCRYYLILKAPNLEPDTLLKIMFRDLALADQPTRWV